MGSKTTEKFKLPMIKLSYKAREVDMLPGIINTLLSVTLFSNEGYTRIFHLHDRGATVNGPESVEITLTKNTILKGW